MEGIEREEMGRDPEFFMPGEVKDLLRAARETNDGELLPYLAIAFFAGLTDDEHAAFTGWCDKLRVSPAEFAWVALTGEIESMGDKSMPEAMVEDVLSRFDGDWRTGKVKLDY